MLALPPMRGDRRKIVRLLVTLIEHLIERGHSDRVELTVEAGEGRVRYRVQESGARRPSPHGDDEERGESSAEEAQLSWALDLVRSVGGLMGGVVMHEGAGEGRAALLLELPLDGPPGASVALG